MGVQQLPGETGIPVAVTAANRMSVQPDKAGRNAPMATAPLMQRDENDLLRRVRAGERELFYELIRPYQKAVYLSALSILGNPADAEEVAQEALLKALSRLEQFRGESKFSTWLIQITINESRMRVRKDRKGLYESIDEGAENEEGDYFPRDFADWREIPTEALERKELRQALLKALLSLAPKYREVFVMRDIHHISIAETARVLGITEGTVKTRLLRARFQMRDALAPGIDGSWVTGREEYKKVRPW
jgi:RNA polymerase sigma-70 factor (ECF subfamily)